MKKLGKYQILDKIDAGGMATIYKGIQRSLNRPVAIKVMHKQLSNDPRFVERFNKESLIIARLNHPNIIHIIDRGITAQGMPYFVMNFVEGTDVAKIIRQGNTTVNRKLDIIIQVCKALSYAHKNNVIHRDIKPANILIDSEKNALVADFGIAQFYDEDAGDHHITKEYVILGTLSYMSPEQKTSSKNITALSDLFSMGVVMYELFTGRKPLGNFQPPSELCDDLSPEIDDIVMSCLASESENRPASADVVKDHLLEILEGAHIQKAKRQDVIKDVIKMEDIFDLLDIIKEHQYGTVYLFRHRINKKLMVVKRYNTPLGGYKIAKLLTNLKHKNIMDIYGVSGSKSHYIIVMEYLSGGNLADRMVMPYSWPEALKIIHSICRGLSFAHKNRIVHGNLRPSNIMFSESDEIKITDFGLNEHYALDPSKANWFNAANQPKSKQADIYAVGAILYNMLTGHVPEFKGSSFKPHQSFKSLPQKIQLLTAKMLTQDLSQRFQSVDQIIMNIQNLPDASILNAGLKTGPVEKQPVSLLKRPARTFFLMGLLLAAVGVYMMVSGQNGDHNALIDRIMRFAEIIFDSLGF